MVTIIMTKVIVTIRSMERDQINALTSGGKTKLTPVPIGFGISLFYQPTKFLNFPTAHP